MSAPYIGRDISWLGFNYRVLQEAMDESVPLYERIKFLAIYSSNLDEFFRVRVASLRSFKELKKKDRKELLDIKPKKELKAIRSMVTRQQEMFGKVFRDQIIPGLQGKGVYLVARDRCSAKQLEFARKYFNEKVQPLLTISHFSINEEPPFLDNKGLYFVIPDEETTGFTVVNIPSDDLPRFIELPSGEKGSHFIIYLDDLMRIGLPELLDRENVRAYSVKLSRDAELYIDNEYDGDLVEKIRTSLDERQVGLPTRFLYDQRMPSEFLSALRKALSLSKYDLIPGGRYHNFNDFFGFPDPLNEASLHDEKLPPMEHPVLKRAGSIMETMRAQDFMLHFPYQQYDYVPQLIREAAVDKTVERLRITLYRVAAKSAVMEGLLLALKNGKEVEVFVEAKARFDEASNLYWGTELSKAGATVKYSYPGIKVHTKLLLIEGSGVNYAYLGTGNFNEKTARLYADHALFTTDERLTKDVRQVFELLAGRLIMPKCKHLLVAPFTLRQQLLSLLDKEIEQAKAGKPAWCFLKMNSLEERGMVEKLYEASQAGVKIRLIVRGICSLVPGVEGVSENIEVISILDRFLEHARVLVFCNKGKEKIYTASADWMSRNLFRRVEVAMPIYDEDVRKELMHIMELQWRDNSKARIINEAQDNIYRKPKKGDDFYRAQTDIYEYLAALG